MFWGHKCIWITQAVSGTRISFVFAIPTYMFWMQYGVKFHVFKIEQPHHHEQMIYMEHTGRVLVKISFLSIGAYISKVSHVCRKAFRITLQKGAEERSQCLGGQGALKNNSTCHMTHWVRGATPELQSASEKYLFNKLAFPRNHICFLERSLWTGDIYHWGKALMWNWVCMQPEWKLLLGPFFVHGQPGRGWQAGSRLFMEAAVLEPVH